MKFGPADSQEAVVFAVEELRADIQYEILRLLKKAGLSQADLARKMGVSQAWVSQILSDDANLTLDSLAKVFLALGEQCKIASARARNTFAKLSRVRLAKVFLALGEQCKIASAPAEMYLTADFGCEVERSFSGWHESRPEVIDRRVVGEASTTQKLMQIVQSGGHARRPIQLTNDNGSLKENKLAAAV